MRNSRAPEGRGTPKPVIFLVLILVLLAAGLGATYFTGGFGALSASPAQAEVTDVSIETPDQPAIDLVSDVVTDVEVVDPAPKVVEIVKPTSVPPTAVPKVSPTAMPMPAPVEIVIPDAEPIVETVVVADERWNLDFLPEVRFGDILDEGLVDLKMPGGETVDTWYTFQVDTEKRDITVFFALFDAEKRSVLSTVQLNNYSKGNDLESGMVTLYYEDGSERVLAFDGAEGAMTLTQHYKIPFGPSMFSPDLRRSLVYYGLELQSEAGDQTMELHLDISGLSQSEKMVFKQSSPDE
ncbi:MAG: hypothetical protein VYE19_07260, partial [Chloroflexota bacterium]|nr:hypothetical protein [Chloroflexota bacterium]